MAVSVRPAGVVRVVAGVFLLRRGGRAGDVAPRVGLGQPVVRAVPRVRGHRPGRGWSV